MSPRGEWTHDYRSLTLGGMVQTWCDEKAGLLRDAFPDWDIWYVPAVYGPVTWCSRRKGAAVAEFNTDSPDELMRLMLGVSPLAG